MSRLFTNIRNKHKRVGIIGIGSLGESLVNMLLRRPNFLLSPISVIGSTVRQNRIDELRNTIMNDTSIKNPDILLTTNNGDIVDKADEIILAVKPGQIKTICDIIRPSISGDIPIISTSAAVPLEKLHQWLPETKIIIRCMPNIPCNIGHGMVPYITKSDPKIAFDIMYNIFAPNNVLSLSSDDEIDISTIISGCGPAFFAWYTECIRQIGADILSNQNLDTMLIQTMKGTAAMLQTYSTNDIIKAVASPKGATEATINNLRQNKIDEEINKALLIAKHRIKSIIDGL